MWTRAQLKSRAKVVLRTNYWRAFFMSLILLVAGAGYSNIDFNNKNHSNINSNVYDNVIYFNDGQVLNENTMSFVPVNMGFFPGFVSVLSGIVAVGIIAVIIAFMLFKILVGYGLQVGGRRYFVNAVNDPQTDYKCLSMAFKDGNLANVIVTMFLRDLFTFLWTLLFIIPGVIKGLSYSMVPYILADNPKMSATRAIQLSQKMTYGHKWKIFVLQLSFIGWYLLGTLAFVVGIAFVFPYENAVFAELYSTLRQDKINSGDTSYEELNMYSSAY